MDADHDPRWGEPTTTAGLPRQARVSRCPAA
jgi:hypothetical protein